MFPEFRNPFLFGCALLSGLGSIEKLCLSQILLGHELERLLLLGFLSLTESKRSTLNTGLKIGTSTLLQRKQREQKPKQKQLKLTLKKLQRH
ncbi:unnamed protein product [Brassica oleracea]